MRSVVFIHGAFMSAESWDPWRQRFEARGHKCVAPAWPFLDHSVEELQRTPDPRFGKLGIGEIVDNYASIIREFETPPILVGHSFGGLFVQLLLDRGFGAAGVAIDPAPPKGVLPGANAVRASLPVILGWRSWDKVRRMSFKDFQWGWVHTLGEPEQRAAYDQHVIPTSGRLFFQALLAQLTDETKVNYRNSLRVPLLIIAGELDRTVGARMDLANFQKYARSTAVTEFREFPGRTHWICRQPGWEEVADYALDWAREAGPRDLAAHTSCVIYDLDAGRPERPGRGGLRMTAVTVAAVGVALVFFTALAFAPGQRASQTPIFTLSAPALPTMARPTFNTLPVPDRTLVLSGDDAVRSFRITLQGQTGLVNNDSVATTYRLRATGDLVTVAPLPQSEALPYTSPLVMDPPLRVRGQAAQATVTINGTSAIRWVENTMVFEMSSRTLTVSQLTELATKLR